MTKLEAMGLAACLAVAVGGCRTTGSVADFVPDGRTGDAIQRAIDAANAAGGGRVTLERGIYESGTIYLKSHVELHIPEGAVLRGAARPEDYDDVDDPRITKAPEKSKKAFIACIGAEDVSITGSGVIDGQGPCFYDTTKRQWGMYAKPPHPRPRMIEFVKCRNVRFSDITFKDSPGWTCWIRMCDDFSAERVKIHADQLMINNDGFHMDGCRRVRIRNCDLKTGDDCIVMRAIQSPCGDSRLCEDMLVEDCNLNIHDRRPEAAFSGCFTIGNVMKEAGDHHFGFIKAFLYRDFSSDVCHPVAVFDPVGNIRLFKLRGILKFIFQECFCFPDPFMIHHGIRSPFHIYILKAWNHYKGFGKQSNSLQTKSRREPVASPLWFWGHGHILNAPGRATTHD